MVTGPRDIGNKPNPAGIMLKLGMIKKILGIDSKVTVHRRKIGSSPRERKRLHMPTRLNCG
jgi:hypothetical protein